MVKRNWKIYVDGYKEKAITGKGNAIKYIYDQAIKRWAIRSAWKLVQRGGYVAYVSEFHGSFEARFE